MRHETIWRRGRSGSDILRARPVVAGLIALALLAGLAGGWLLWQAQGATPPATPRTIRLPFAAGPVWTVANTTTDGTSALTFTRSDGATADEQVLSPASGAIRWLNPAAGSLAIDLGDGYAIGLTTAALDPALTAGQTLRQGQPVGTTTKPTVARNAQTPRIALALWRIAGGQQLQPVPFTGAHALDGHDFPHNATAATTVVSTNEPVAGVDPDVPALKGPASDIHIAATRARVTLTWNPVPGAAAYQVEVNGAAASPWVTAPIWTTDALPAGTYSWRVRAKGETGAGPLSAPWTFIVDSAAPAMAAGPAGIAASAPEAEVGTTLHLTGAGFAPDEAVSVRWDGQPLLTVNAGSNGAIAADLTVPESTGGGHTLTARGESIGKMPATTVTVRPSLARGPASAVPGSPIAVAARGFAANESVRLTWHTAGGAALGTIATDGRGTGSVTIVLPDGGPGWNDYSGSGATSKRQAWGAIEIQPSLTASAPVTSPGQRVDLTGRGLPPGQPVAIAWNRTAGEPGAAVCQGAADADGRYACTVKVPASNAGTYPIVLTGAGDLAVPARITVSGPPGVTVTPGDAAAGTNVTVALGGFAPREAVALTLGGQPWRTVKVDAHGALSLPTTVPPRGAGATTLAARGASSGRAAQASFMVAGAASAGSGPDIVRPGVYRVTATREGLVGKTTSTGHVIVPDDRFVALPACLASNCPWLKAGKDDPIWGVRTECADKCYVKSTNPATGACAVAPVWDVGPWFRSDDWWRPAGERRLNTKLGSPNTLAQGYPGTEAARDGLDVGYGTGPGGYGASDKYADVGNRAAIDLADGTWNDLGLDFARGIASGIEIQLLWQTGQAPADAARGCAAGADAARDGLAGHGKLAASVMATAGRMAGPGAAATPDRFDWRRVCIPVLSFRSMALPSPSRRWTRRRRWRR